MIGKALVGSLITLSTLASAAWSAPTVQVKSGQTIFILQDQVAEALEVCDLQRVKPAVVKPQDNQVRLAITGGVLDQETLSGEVNHSGGLSLSCFGGISTVSLQNFRLDAAGDAWQISAVVAIDGDMQQRMPVLMPVGEPDLQLSSSGLVRLRNLEVTLSQDIVDVLLGELGLAAGTTDVIGVVSSRVKLRSADKPSTPKQDKSSQKEKQADEDDDEEASEDD